jgi:hypothetical protein
MSLPYPYPKLGDDGYELQVVEQDGSPGYPVLSRPLVSDEERYAAKPGDVVKLIFLYRDHVERNGQTYGAEHMWVRITDCGEGCLIGRLDNAPQFTSLLKVDDEVHFHPKHIVRFWSDETTG